MVGAPAEAHRDVVGAAQIERVGVLEARRITVGCALEHHHAVAPYEGFALQVGRLQRGSQVELHGAVEAQQLFDRRRRELRIRAPVPQLPGMLQEGQQPVAE